MKRPQESIDYDLDDDVENDRSKKLKQQILDDQSIVENVEKEYKLFKDGFSNLEGYCEGYSQLRNQIDELFKSLLTKNDNGEGEN